MSKEPEENLDETTGEASTPSASAAVPPVPGATPTPPPRAAPPLPPLPAVSGAPGAAPTTVAPVPSAPPDPGPTLTAATTTAPIPSVSPPASAVPPPPPPPPITGAAPRAAAPGTPPPPAPGTVAPGAATIAAPAATSTSRIPPANYNKMAAEMAALETLLASASKEVTDSLKELQKQVKVVENADTAADVPVKDLKQLLEAPMKALQGAIAADTSITDDTKQKIAIHSKNINESFANHTELLMQQANQSRQQLARKTLKDAFGLGGGLPPQASQAIGGGTHTGVDTGEHFIDRLLREGGRVTAKEAGKNYWTYAKAWLDVKILPGGEKRLSSNNPAYLAAAAKAAGYTSFEFSSGSPASILKAMKEFAKEGIAVSISPEKLKEFSAAQKEKMQENIYNARFGNKFESYKVVSEGITKAHSTATLREYSDPNKFSSKIADEMDEGLEHQETYASALGETSGYEIPAWTRQSVAPWHDAMKPTTTPSAKFDAAKNLDSELLKNVVKSPSTGKLVSDPNTVLGIQSSAISPQDKAVALNALMNQKGAGPELQKELKSMLPYMKDKVAVVKSLLALQDKDPKFKLSDQQVSDLKDVLSTSSNRNIKRAVDREIDKRDQQQQQRQTAPPAPR